MLERYKQFIAPVETDDFQLAMEMMDDLHRVVEGYREAVSSVMYEEFVNACSQRRTGSNPD